MCAHTHKADVSTEIYVPERKKKKLACEIKYTTLGYRPHGRNRKECHPGNHQQQF